MRNAYEYRDTYRDRTWSMAVFRNREAPQIRTTGALAVASTHLKSPQAGVAGEALVEGGLWAGRALPVGSAPFGGLSRKAIVPAVGWSAVDFTERPDSVSENFNRRYQDRHLFLSSLSYTQSDFEHGRLLWGYGWTEDIPHGLLATLTGGLELGEFETRGYGGGELRAAKYTGFGYLGIRAAAGAFIHERMVEDGVVDVSVGYFSRLLAAGGFGFRQFVNTSYTIGFRRSENDPIPLDPPTGLAAGISGSSLRDRARLIGGLESVLFSPWTAYGFRFAFFGKFDICTLGREADSFLDGKYYSMVGFGIRLHNERLVRSGPRSCASPSPCRRRRGMSGGLTISGGEPLMQDRFVVKMFQAAKGMGIHTAIDTNGYYGERLTDAELDGVDLVLLDIKAWDEDKHRHLTGREPGPTREFAKRLAARRRPVWLRFVLVPGLTDDPTEVEQIAQFAGSLGTVERVGVLPFHQMGRYKWENLGIEYKLGSVEPPSAEAVERACATFRAAGLKTY